MSELIDWQKVIEFECETITQEWLDAFASATLSEHSAGIPLTFVTTFRKSEFHWLDYLKVDLRKLLHTDQEYEYLQPLKVGDKPRIRTRLLNKKLRSSLNFYTLETEVICGDEVAILGRSSFVVRDQGEIS